MRLLIENYNEYEETIAIEKVFDSVELWAIPDALDEYRTDLKYSKMVK